VPQGDGLGQLFVQLQDLGNGPRDLRDLQGVREARAVVIAGRRTSAIATALSTPRRSGA
jgi:hypothetical protein